MSNLSHGLLLASLLVIAAGCNEPRNDASAKPVISAEPLPVAAKPAITPPVSQPVPTPEKPPEPTPEEIGREKIKLGLDAWVFGDTQKQFEVNHSDIMFTDFDWIGGEALLRYEIGQSRIKSMKIKDGKPYPFLEFVVTLTQTNRGGQEMVKKKSYTVRPPDSAEPRWMVTGLNK